MLSVISKSHHPISLEHLEIIFWSENLLQKPKVTLKTEKMSLWMENTLRCTYLEWFSLCSGPQGLHTEKTTWNKQWSSKVHFIPRTGPQVHLIPNKPFPVCEVCFWWPHLLIKKTDPFRLKPNSLRNSSQMTEHFLRGNFYKQSVSKEVSPLWLDFRCIARLRAFSSDHLFAEGKVLVAVPRNSSPSWVH